MRDQRALLSMMRMGCRRLWGLQGGSARRRDGSACWCKARGRPKLNASCRPSTPEVMAADTTDEPKTAQSRQSAAGQGAGNQASQRSSQRLGETGPHLTRQEETSTTCCLPPSSLQASATLTTPCGECRQARRARGGRAGGRDWAAWQQLHRWQQRHTRSRNALACPPTHPPTRPNDRPHARPPTHPPPLT